MQDLIEMEKEGWQALATDQEAGQKFYNSILHSDAVMLFPGGLLLNGKEEILKSFNTQPWKSFQIKNPKVIKLTDPDRSRPLSLDGYCCQI